MKWERASGSGALSPFLLPLWAGSPFGGFDIPVLPRCNERMAEPWFILIPGAGGMAWYWHRIMPLLEQAGSEAIAGGGRSGRSERSRKSSWLPNRWPGSSPPCLRSGRNSRADIRQCHDSPARRNRGGLVRQYGAVDARIAGARTVGAPRSSTFRSTFCTMSRKQRSAAGPRVSGSSPTRCPQWQGRRRAQRRRTTEKRSGRFR